MNHGNHTRRVFCIGLDGGTWSILQPLMAAGRMPHLTTLAQAGCSGVLHSTVPPITPAAWSTFMTGCNPGKHGIFDFQGYDRQTRSSFYVNATSLRVPTLWQVLSQHGKRVAVVDLPVTYPPPAVNGVVLSGLMTPGRESNFTHPASLCAELERHLGYEWPLLKEDDENWGIHKDIAGFLRLMRRYLDSRVQAMLYLFKKEKWDFSFLQLQCVDFLQHPLWKQLDASHPAYRPDLHEEVIRQFFMPLDESLGRLSAEARSVLGEDALIVILSDHGFQRHVKRAELNHWLYAHGFLAPAEIAKTSWARWVELVRKLDVWKLRGHLLTKTQRHELGRVVSARRIDEERSRFFAISAFWGYLYSGSHTTARDFAELEQDLLAWKDPENGQPVVRHVHRREQCYHGAACERMPDVVIEPMPGYTFASKTYFQEGRLVHTVAENDFHTGTHASEGVFIVCGAGVQRSGLCQGPEAGLQDLMPTLLHWMGLPVPQYCDGRVTSAWFKPDFTAKITYDGTAATAAEEVRFSAEEQSEIERRLQMLGYV